MTCRSEQHSRTRHEPGARRSVGRQLLGDYGADVVKIERPGKGDDTRQWGPPWLGSESALFPVHQPEQALVTVDIATAAAAGDSRAGREGDVLLENFKIGTLTRYGLDPAS